MPEGLILMPKHDQLQRETKVAAMKAAEPRGGGETMARKIAEEKQAAAEMAKCP